MNTRINYFLSITILFASTLWSSCKKEDAFNPVDNNKVPADQKVFDVTTFKENIIEGLGEEWAGYQFYICENGLSTAWGSYGKRIAGNDGNIAQDIEAPMYGGSIGKFITAVAVLRALNVYTASGAAVMLDAPLVNYLPKNWKIGNNISSLTIRNFLQHRTGIDVNDPTSYSGLKNLLENGLPSNKPYEYSNANFAIFRIVLPIIIGTVKASVESNTSEMEDKTSLAFKRFVQTEIFDPIGVSAGTEPFGNYPARYYKFPDLPDANGWVMDDMTLRLGNGGWFISAKEYCKFLAYLNHSESVLNATTRKLLYDNFLGLSDISAPTNNATGDRGLYYTKGGSFQDNGRGVRNIIAIFPQSKTEIVIMANSRGGAMDNTSGIRNMVFKAYDDAWIIKD